MWVSVHLSICLPSHLTVTAVHYLHIIALLQGYADPSYTTISWRSMLMTLLWTLSPPVLYWCQFDLYNSTLFTYHNNASSLDTSHTYFVDNFNNNIVQTSVTSPQIGQGHIIVQCPRNNIPQTNMTMMGNICSLIYFWNKRTAFYIYTNAEKCVLKGYLDWQN